MLRNARPNPEPAGVQANLHKSLRDDSDSPSLEYFYVISSCVAQSRNARPTGTKVEGKTRMRGKDRMTDR